MIRPMGEFTVSQRTKDSYFDGGDLLRQWNVSCRLFNTPWGYIPEKD